MRPASERCAAAREHDAAKRVAAASTEAEREETKRVRVAAESTEIKGVEVKQVGAWCCCSVCTSERSAPTTEDEGVRGHSCSVLLCRVGSDERAEEAAASAAAGGSGAEGVGGTREVAAVGTAGEDEAALRVVVCCSFFDFAGKCSRSETE